MAAQPRCTKEDVEAGSAGPACRLAGLSTPFLRIARVGEDKLSSACALRPPSSGGYEPENSVSVAFARSALGTEPIDHVRLKPDEALAALVGLSLVAHAAERELIAMRTCGAWS
jgi:hypothetical protein